MGYTHVTVTVSNLQKSKPPYTASFLVDTGAIEGRTIQKTLEKIILPSIILSNV